MSDLNLMHLAEILKEMRMNNNFNLKIWEELKAIRKLMEEKK